MKIPLFLVKAHVLSNKTLPTKVKSFLMITFGLNQTWKKCLQETVQFRTSLQYACIIFALKAWERLSGYKGYRNIKVCKRLRLVEKNNVCKINYAEKL